MRTIEGRSAGPDTMSVFCKGCRYVLKLHYEPVVNEWLESYALSCRLSVVADPRYPLIEPESLLSCLSRTEQLRMLIWLFTRLRATGENIRITLPARMSEMCLRSPALRELLSVGGISLALGGEISREVMLNVQLLSTFCPVWLDDLGSGKSTLMMMSSGMFTGVVISAELTRALITSEAGIMVLQSLVSFCRYAGCHVVMKGDCGALLSRMGGCGVSGFEQAEKDTAKYGAGESQKRA